MQLKESKHHIRNTKYSYFVPTLSIFTGPVAYIKLNSLAVYIYKTHI